MTRKDLWLVSLNWQHNMVGMGKSRITALLKQEGWLVNHKKVERIWRKEGLKVPKKQPKRARLWLNDGSCIRLRPEYKDHVWSYDLMMARTAEGRVFRILTIIDKYIRQCLTYSYPSTSCLSGCYRSVVLSIYVQRHPRIYSLWQRSWIHMKDSTQMVR